MPAATLYAYVSRGRIESRPGEDGRSREYRSEDVQRLIERRQAGRGAAQGAAHSLTWGLPVLETRISLIRPQGPYYRGQSAIDLARGGATMEDTARLLWGVSGPDPFAAAPARWPAAVEVLLRQRGLPPLTRASAALPLLAQDAQRQHSADPGQRRENAALLLRQHAAVLAGARPGRKPLHALLAAAWSGDARLGEVLRSALVLCADHELNASAFAARVAASTGAGLHAAASAGLAALSGPQHGGATARAYALIAGLLGARRPGALVRERVQRGDALAGFGHPLYPEGDPRAALLLTQLLGVRPRLAGAARLQQALDAAIDLTGRQPSLDFALASLAALFGLGPEAALSVFAAGRMAGWLAHALEQQETGGLIRPRANYAGIPPPRLGGMVRPAAHLPPETAGPRENR